MCVHHPVTQVEGRLDAQERHIKPTADERLGEVLGTLTFATGTNFVGSSTRKSAAFIR